MNLEEALELRKAKYLKRTGSPGRYKYIYKEKKSKLPIGKELLEGFKTITESSKRGTYIAIGNFIDYKKGNLKAVEQSLQREFKNNIYENNIGAYWSIMFKLHVIKDMIKKGNKSKYKKLVNDAFKENKRVVEEARRKK